MKFSSLLIALISVSTAVGQGNGNWNDNGNRNGNGNGKANGPHSDPPGQGGTGGKQPSTPGIDLPVITTIIVPTLTPVSSTPDEDRVEDAIMDEENSVCPLVQGSCELTDEPILNCRGCFYRGTCEVISTGVIDITTCVPTGPGTLTTGKNGNDCNNPNGRGVMCTHISAPSEAPSNMPSMATMDEEIVTEDTSEVILDGSMTEDSVDGSLETGSPSDAPSMSPTSDGCPVVDSTCDHVDDAESIIQCRGCFYRSLCEVEKAGFDVAICQPTGSGTLIAWTNGEGCKNPNLRGVKCVETAAPSDLPSDAPSLMPSLVPTLAGSDIPSGVPSTSSQPTTSDVPSETSLENPIPVGALEGSSTSLQETYANVAPESKSVSTAGTSVIVVVAILSMSVVSVASVMMIRRRNARRV